MPIFFAWIDDCSVLPNDYIFIYNSSEYFPVTRVVHTQKAGKAEHLMPVYIAEFSDFFIIM